MKDIAHLLRPGHLAQLRKILEDPEATNNDKFVALDLLKNAVIASGGVLPMCQDTGTAIIKGKKGQFVFTGGGDEEAIAKGVYKTYTETNLRYSQLAPLSCSKRRTPATTCRQRSSLGHRRRRLPLPVHGQGRRLGEQELPVPGDQGAAQPSEPDEVARREAAQRWAPRRARPYHLAVVIGGTSAEYALKTAKLASARYLDDLPKKGSDQGHGFRDVELEGEVHRADAAPRHRRAVRRQVLLPRRARDSPAASRRELPGRHRRELLGRPPGARQDHADGVFLEELERDPARTCPRSTRRRSAARW
jgi:fumarate hydratase class I